MWRYLRLTGLGVIEEASLDLEHGFSVITGETGAGKTMIVTALGLLRGERSDAGLVRSNIEQARVEAEIEVSPQIREICDDVAAEIEDEHVLLARVVSAQGRSRAYLGGASVPASVLSRLSQHSVAVHGQADQYRLLQAGEQRTALDDYAGAELSTVVEKYSRGFAAYNVAKARLREIRESSQERARELDQLQFGLQEIAEVEPEPGEDDSLQHESERLANIETLLHAAQQAHELMAGGAIDADGALAALGGAAEQLERASEHDPPLQTLAQRLREVSFVVSDTATDLAGYIANLDVDPARIEQVEQRRSDLARVKRKYGETIDDVIAWAETAGKRVLELEIDDEAIAALEYQVEQQGAELLDLAKELSRLRNEAGERLAAAVSAELGGLAMPHARLEVRIACPDDPTPEDLGTHGLDTVEFWFTANTGTEPRPLSKGASGGELSRIMLALELILVDSNAVPTLVFDEVDAGIGGKAAVEVGRRLARLAQRAQVLAVTHLPQVAAFADHHFHVTKSHDGTITRSSVRRLDGDSRVEELSRMLAGQDESASAQQHARELLDAARSDRAK